MAHNFREWMDIKLYCSTRTSNTHIIYTENNNRVVYARNVLCIQLVHITLVLMPRIIHHRSYYDIYTYVDGSVCWCYSTIYVEHHINTVPRVAV